MKLWFLTLSLVVVLTTASPARPDFERDVASGGENPARGNDACAQFCAVIYAPGLLRGRCISDAAHGLGLCIGCQADVDRVCGLPENQFCCDAGTICVSGQCPPVCPTGTLGDDNNCSHCGDICPSSDCNGDELLYQGLCKVNCQFNAGIFCPNQFPGTTCFDGACRDQTGAVVFP